jgi:hypothetical protein
MADFWKRLIQGPEFGVPVEDTRKAVNLAIYDTKKPTAKFSMNRHTYTAPGTEDPQTHEPRVEYGIRSRMGEVKENIVAGVVSWLPEITAVAYCVLKGFKIAYNAVTGFQDGESITEVNDITELVLGGGALVGIAGTTLVARIGARQRREWQNGLDATRTHTLDLGPEAKNV